MITFDAGRTHALPFPKQGDKTCHYNEDCSDALGAAYFSADCLGVDRNGACNFSDSSQAVDYCGPKELKDPACQVIGPPAIVVNCTGYCVKNINLACYVGVNECQ